jgi:hypothetical protein
MTRGDGFDDADLGQTWPQIITQTFMFDSDNLAVSGASNHMIFMLASQAIQSGKYDIVFAQWTALNRVWLSPGPNCWYYATGDGRDEFDYRDIHLTAKEKTQLEQRLLLLNHDYQNIVYLIDYVSILNDLARLHGVKLAHVNGMVPWQADLMVDDKDFNIISDYSRSLLDFDQRNDEEIDELYSQLKLKFSTVDRTCWVNIFDSFQSNMTDVGPLGHHPGPTSHLVMAKKVANFLSQGTQ